MEGLTESIHSWFYNAFAYCLPSSATDSKSTNKSKSKWRFHGQKDMYTSWLTSPREALLVQILMIVGPEHIRWCNENFDKATGQMLPTKAANGLVSGDKDKCRGLFNDVEKRDASAVDK